MLHEIRGGDVTIEKQKKETTYTVHKPGEMRLRPCGLTRVELVRRTSSNTIIRRGGGGDHDVAK